MCVRDKSDVRIFLFPFFITPHCFKQFLMPNHFNLLRGGYGNLGLWPLLEWICPPAYNERPILEPISTCACVLGLCNHFFLGGSCIHETSGKVYGSF